MSLQSNQHKHKMSLQSNKHSRISSQPYHTYQENVTDEETEVNEIICNRAEIDQEYPPYYINSKQNHMKSSSQGTN